MADIFSPKKRSEVMALIRAKDTKAELAFRKLLSKQVYPLGYRYRKNYRSIPGTPDVVFLRQKVVIFIDGDFWHGRYYKKIEPKLSASYWKPKIKRNMERDVRVNGDLRRAGWRVIRIWESDFKRQPERHISQAVRALQQ